MTERRLRIVLLCVVTLLVLGLVVLLRPGPALYRVTILPYPGGGYMTACGMNDRGQIVGLARALSGETHLFLWNRGKGLQDLGPVTGNYLGINNAGQIAGTMVDPNGKQQVFLWDPNTGRQLLGTLGGTWPQAIAINDSGQVVAVVGLPLGVSHAFLWDGADGMRDLGPGCPCAINNAGQILVATGPGPVGDLLLSANGGSTGARMPVTTLGLRSINNHGCVVGHPTVSGIGPGLAIWHSNSGVMTSTRIGGDARAYIINDVNQVLFAREQSGRYKIFGRVIPPYRIRCYLQDPVRALIPLSGYVHPGPNEYFYPVDLNDKGCIVGAIGPNRGRASRVVLLEPIPERWGR